MIKKLKLFFFTNTSNKQTVAKNTIWLTLSEGLGRLLKLALIIYAARIIGVQGWGTFSYVLSAGSILMIFSDIGISTIITREISQKKESYRAYIASALTVKAIFLFISALMVLFVGPLISRIPGTTSLFALMAIILFFDSIRDLFVAINKASEKMERELVVKIIMNVTTLIFGVTLLAINPNPRAVAIAYAIGSMVGLITIIVLAKKELKELVKFRRKKSLMKLIISTAWPFAIISLILIILSNMDTVLLGIWRDPTEIGLYSSMQRLQQFALIIPTMISGALFPLFSRLAYRDDHQFKTILERSVSFVLIIGIPLSIGGILLSYQIVPFIFGTAYSAAAPLLIVLLISLLLSFPLIILSNAVFAYDKQRSIVPIYISGAIINVLLNIILIPRYGALGSSIATLFSTAVIVIAVWHKLQSINEFSVASRLTKSILATTIMTGAIFGLQFVNAPLLLILCIAPILYVATLIATKDSLYNEIKDVFKNHPSVV